jgi:hypothetical protein
MPQQRLELHQLRALIQQFGSTGEDLERFCSRAADPYYWISLNPEHSISVDGRVSWDGESAVSDDVIERATRNYRTYGFLSLSGILSVAQVARMRAVIERLRSADWLPVFSFIYDDFWLIGRSKQLRALLASVLHPEYRLLTRIWTHYVQIAPGNGGWTPHLDHPDETGHTASVWIPISRATLTNGCMHLVKRNSRTDKLCKEFPGQANFSKPQVIDLLKNCRALPAEPGSVLLWDEKILHWGAQVEDCDEPRISIALEFTVPEFREADNREALLDPMTALPSFEQRLELICGSILSYRRFEPMVERYAPLARALLSTRFKENNVALLERTTPV